MSSVATSRMVVSVAVVYVSVEAVLVGIVLDGPRVAAGFLDRVLSYHFVSIT
jgi:hypothetical protein